MKREPFHPCDTWCGIKCISDSYSCIFEKSCGYRGSFIGSLRVKQRRMMSRYLAQNKSYDGYIPVSELIALAKVYLKTGFVCWYCGEKMYVNAGYHQGYRMWTADHRKPLFAGGKNRIENIVFCCYECNSEQGAMWQKKMNGK